MKRILFRPLAFRKGENWHYFSGKTPHSANGPPKMTKTALFPRKKTPLRQFSQLAERGGICIWCLTVRAFLALRQFLGLAEGVNS